MLSRTYCVKENVQVLDAVTSICIFSLISDWCVKVKWSDWPEYAIFNVPEDRKENAAAWNIRNFANNHTCVISRRRNSRKEKQSFNPRRLHRDLMSLFRTNWECQKRIVIIIDPFVSHCTVRWVDKPQKTAGNGPSCCSSLYVKYSNLRNESHGQSRKRVTATSFLKKFMIKAAEKSRHEKTLRAQGH